MEVIGTVAGAITLIETCLKYKDYYSDVKNAKKEIIAPVIMCWGKTKSCRAASRDGVLQQWSPTFVIYLREVFGPNPADIAADCAN